MTMAPEQSPFDAEFDVLVKEQLEKWKVPGLSIAVIHGPNTYTKAYGKAELPNPTTDRPPRDMTTDTLFAACSTTKAFTSAATSMAIQDSKATKSPIDWDTSLASLIPEDFILENEYATKNITLEDALSHRSGMPDHNWTLALCSNDGQTPRSIVRAMQYMPLATPPRTKYHYSNHMFIAVSHALEQHTGETLGAFMKKRIWDPLGMSETFFSPSEAQANPSTAAKLVQAYDWAPTEEGGTFIPKPQLDWKPNSGAGAIVSSVVDYARWIRELIEKAGPLKGHDSLTDPRTIYFQNDDLNLPAPYHGYALGWVVDNYRGQHFYSHAGGWPGYGNWVGFVPEKKFGFVVMGNSSSARYAAFRLATYLLDRRLGLSDDPKYEQQIDACIARQTQTWESSLEYEDVEDSKKRVFPSLPAPPIPCTLPLSGYAGTYRHPMGVTLFIRISIDGLIVDLRDRVIPCELSLAHASGEHFVGSIHNSGLNLLPPFPVEFYIDATGVVKRVGLLLEPALKDKKLWFDRCDS
ncbi:Peptidase S12 Pab87-related C-terminal [Penicillium robsamsonii]|uniref:Peptidase S12 Pab87-related C-terminal n=1 Tax=Penicillium robsamsonii TaxID=1792511 RepID=UPI00254917FF|nr:Peptidase S12 Pab87-related C-terminal [Penicillium robsamsonii]KAJ5816494.1 Peptidase S12 Pab87-related C-terminal [Penicillium robsamsonii]